MRSPLFRASVATVPLSFVAALALKTQTFGADVKTYVLEKGIQFIQNDAGAALADSNNGAVFSVTVKAAGTNYITTAEVGLPSGTVQTVPQTAADEFKFNKKYNKQTTLDANYPDGTYTVRLDTAHDGSKALPLSLVGDLYPNTPHFANFSATQAIDAGAFNLFTWDPFTGGGTNDFAQLHIEDNQGNKVWETPDEGELGALDGRAVSALVPSNNLSAGQVYQAYIYFAKSVSRDESTYPGAVGFSGYYKRTKLTVQTTVQASQADTKTYRIIKSRRFQQTDSAAPVPQSTKTFDFEAFVNGTSTGAVTAATISLPAGLAENLPLQTDNKSFDLSDSAESQSALDSVYSNGAYAFQIQTAHGGVKSPRVNVLGDLYPNPPHILNFTTTVDPKADWVVSWEPFAGGTETDFVQLHIEDDQGNQLFETSNLGKSSALNGTALSAAVPHDTLPGGKSLSARVVFQKTAALDTISYPGALGVAAYATRTSFTINTTSGAGAQPVTLSLAPVGSPGSYRLLVSGTGGQSVRIDTSTDLRQWFPSSTNAVPAGGQLEVPGVQTSGAGATFYRAVTLP
jgi:hypothetical protein